MTADARTPAATGAGAVGSGVSDGPPKPDRRPLLASLTLSEAGAGPRPPLRHTGDLLAQGLHPPHHALPGPLRLLHLRQAPGPARRSLPDLEEVLAIARAGRRRRVPRGPLHPGGGPRGRATRSRPRLARGHGFSSTVDYLAQCCRLVTGETGLLPHANAGALDARGAGPAPGGGGQPGDDARVPRLRDLACHRASPDKTPARRLATLEAAGRLGIAFTTGILVGIGETRADRLAALRAIAASHARHGHVQEVIVQNFLPKPGTAMQPRRPARRGAPLDDRRRPARAASRDPPAGAAEPHRRLRPACSLRASMTGAGSHPVTADHVNPERAWPALGRPAGGHRSGRPRPRPPPRRASRVGPGHDALWHPSSLTP